MSKGNPNFFKLGFLALELVNLGQVWQSNSRIDKN